MMKRKRNKKKGNKEKICTQPTQGEKCNFGKGWGEKNMIFALGKIYTPGNWLNIYFAILFFIYILDISIYLIFIWVGL